MIVKGYKGIMDLDLSQIDPKFHTDVVRQHFEDITEYKREQSIRPDKLRYENAIGHAFNIFELERKAMYKMRKERDDLQKQTDQERENIRLRIQEIKKQYKL